MNNLGKTEILKLLKEFDTLLNEPLEIIICGGAAGILSHGYSRATMDIDIVNSIPKLSTVESAIINIAEKYEISKKWLNDGVKGFVDYLPDDFRKRIIAIEGNFKFLKVFTLSKIDLLIMKLAAFRPEDLKDIELMEIGKNELSLIKTTLTKISSFDKKKAYLIEMFLKEKNLF